MKCACHSESRGAFLQCDVARQIAKLLFKQTLKFLSKALNVALDISRRVTFQEDRAFLTDKDAQ